MRVTSSIISSLCNANTRISNTVKNKTGPVGSSISSVHQNSGVNLQHKPSPRCYGRKAGKRLLQSSLNNVGKDSSTQSPEKCYSKATGAKAGAAVQKRLFSLLYPTPQAARRPSLDLLK